MKEQTAREIYYIDRMVLLGRWGVISFLGLYGIVSAWVVADVYDDNSVFFASRFFLPLILWLVINALYQKTGGPKSRNTTLVRLGIDICFSLVFVHYTGGALSFCFVLFLLVSLEAALQLRGTRLPLSVTAVATVLFGVLLSGESLGFPQPVTSPFFNLSSHSGFLDFFVFLLSGLLNFAGAIVVSYITDENRKISHKVNTGTDRDKTTNVYTREVFFHQLNSEINRCSRSHQALSLVMAGVDNMEEYNTKFGYRAGDRLLAAVGDVITKNVRKNFRAEVEFKDTVCRYYGDIFAIILPEAEPAYNVEEMNKLKGQIHARGVLLVARRLQNRIGGIAGAYGPVQVSLGGGHWPYHGKTADELAREVFRAFQEAKSQGGNRVVVAVKGT